MDESWLRPNGLHEDLILDLPSEVASCTIYEHISQHFRVGSGQVDPWKALW